MLKLEELLSDRFLACTFSNIVDKATYLYDLYVGFGASFGALGAMSGIATATGSLTAANAILVSDAWL